MKCTVGNFLNRCSHGNLFLFQCQDGMLRVSLLSPVDFSVQATDIRLVGGYGKIPSQKKGKSAEPVTAPKVDDNEVIGKTNIVYLEDPEIACKVPARSEPLPPAEEMEEEEDISADDVESTFTGNPPGGLSEEEKAELMSDYVSEVDEDFSTGMTYEDMMNAVGVLTGENRNTNDEKVIRTVKSIYDIRQTEIFDFSPPK